MRLDLNKFYEVLPGTNPYGILSTSQTFSSVRESMYIPPWSFRAYYYIEDSPIKFSFYLWAHERITDEENSSLVKMIRSRDPFDRVVAITIITNKMDEYEESMLAKTKTR